MFIFVLRCANLHSYFLQGNFLNLNLLILRIKLIKTIWAFVINIRQVRQRRMGMVGSLCDEGSEGGSSKFKQLITFLPHQCITSLVKIITCYSTKNV